MRKPYFFFFLFLSSVSVSYSQMALTVQLPDGRLEGIRKDGVTAYFGIPYAQAPVGNLRWKEPQPVKRWKGVLVANHFGHRAPQRNSYKDMIFRSDSSSEDCLYLNVWTPAKSGNEKLPVLVYFHGGGLSSGDGSEERYDGASMAMKGIVSVTVNYRLGIFGFFAHPLLTKESSHHASGNYGFLDQLAALRWIKANIAFFGGDPIKVTIAGQSAGSISVSAHMASPLSKGLFRSAIGQSGSILGSLVPISLAKAESNGARFAEAIGCKTLADLRKMSAGQLATLSIKEEVPYFDPVIDGYFFPQSPVKIYATGLQVDVPLLAGWTSAEVTYQYLLRNDSATITDYKSKLRQLYNGKADEVLQFYPAATKEEMVRSATDLASDRFIAYGTWKWIDLHGKTSGSTVYRYLFAKSLPSGNDTIYKATSVLLGAPHSSDIEYALGNLSKSKLHYWTAADDSVSQLMQSYFVNFIKNGNPNGTNLPNWPGLQSSIPKVMVFGTVSKAEGEKNLKRYVFLDQFYYR